jgi:hypothetical protein
VHRILDRTDLIASMAASGGRPGSLSIQSSTTTMYFRLDTIGWATGTCE